MKKKFTYFGFNKIEKNKKQEMVNNVFHDISNKYDIMNDLMSLGIHRLWKCFLVKNSNILNNQKILDVAGGTGDLTKKFSYLVGKKGQVILLDYNSSMIKLAKYKMQNLGLIKNIFYVQGDAEKLPFIDNYFNCISISFGLRNITNPEKALYSMYRVLKPGGHILILEFYQPDFFILKKLYNFYSFYIVPYIGKYVANNIKSYKYLIESIRMHHSQENLKCMMQKIGFKNVTYFNLTGGIVAIHQGFKFY